MYPSAKYRERPEKVSREALSAGGSRIFGGRKSSGLRKIGRAEIKSPSSARGWASRRLRRRLAGQFTTDRTSGTEKTGTKQDQASRLRRAVYRDVVELMELRVLSPRDAYQVVKGIREVVGHETEAVDSRA